MVERAVPFPGRWKTALNSLQLHKTVREGAEFVTNLGTSNITCELVGQAKWACDENFGKTVTLNENVSRVLFLLCARIENDEWLVHKGSYENDVLATDPFQEKDFAVKNLVKDAWDYIKQLREDPKGFCSNQRLSYGANWSLLRISEQRK